MLKCLRKPEQEYDLGVVERKPFITCSVLEHLSLEPPKRPVVAEDSRILWLIIELGQKI